MVHHKRKRSASTVTKRKKPKTSKGSSSSGDLVKRMYTYKKKPAGVIKRQKKFKAKVDKVLEGEFPIERILEQSGMQISTSIAQQGANVIPLRDVTQMRDMNKQVQQVASVVSDSNFKFHCQHSFQDIMYTNNGGNTAGTIASTAVIDWYLVVGKTDNDNDPLQDWVYANTTSLEGSTGGQTAGTITANTVGNTPFLFAEFTRKWKILSKTRVLLQPGETKTFSRAAKAAMIDLKRAEQSGTYLKNVKGISTYLMPVVYGTPSHDSVTRTNVAPAPACVDFVWTTTHICRAVASIAPVGPSTSRTYLGTAFSAVAVAKGDSEFITNLATIFAN